MKQDIGIKLYEDSLEVMDLLNQHTDKNAFIKSTQKTEYRGTKDRQGNWGIGVKKENEKEKGIWISTGYSNDPTNDSIRLAAFDRNLPVLRLDKNGNAVRESLSRITEKEKIKFFALYVSQIKKEIQILIKEGV